MIRSSVVDSFLFLRVNDGRPVEKVVHPKNTIAPVLEPTPIPKRYETPSFSPALALAMQHLIGARAANQKETTPTAARLGKPAFKAQALPIQNKDPPKKRPNPL